MNLLCLTSAKAEAVLLTLVLQVATTTATWANSAHPCGDISNAYGPFDYRKERTGMLEKVDRYHFTTEVEMLVKGTSGYLGGDIDYTLRASPNHHRALITVSNYGIRENKLQPPNTRYTVDCYFDRARRFQPDDVMVPLLYARYLSLAGRIDEAKVQLAIAGKMAGENALTHYNVGLLYFDAKDLDAALFHALKARELGNPRQELLDKLKAAGKVIDTPESQAVN